MIGLPASTWVSGLRHYRYAQGDRWAGGAGQQVLEEKPYSGALFAFRGKRGDLVKLLCYDGQGLCLFPSGWTGALCLAITAAGKVSCPAFHAARRH
jgi:hypothetical protein